jgi:hypothetical protein
LFVDAPRPFNQIFEALAASDAAGLKLQWENATSFYRILFCDGMLFA